MRTVATILLSLCLLATPRPAAAWGFEPHKFIMDRAIALLPAEIRPYFEKHRAVIVERSIDPDLAIHITGWRDEAPRHFVDMDAYGPHPFKDLPHDLDEAVKRYGREFVDKNGTLPWRTEEIYKKLVESFQQRTPINRDNIKYFAPFLVHYVSDAHVPFHAALNYDGQLTGQWGIHSRFESELFERYRDKLTIAPGPLTEVKNAREYMFEVLVTSFPSVQPILDADKAAVAGREVYDDGYFTMFFSKVQPILEKRLSDAIAASASIITSAWVEAGRPALPLESPRTPRKVRR